MPAQVIAFPCLSDNIGILVHDPSTGATAAIDVPDAVPVLARLQARGWSLTHILITHKHGDHVAGLEILKAKTGATVFGPAAERDSIPVLDVAVSDGDRVDVGKLSFQVMETPGHTLGHVVYFEQSEKWLFAGDTLLAMGCGRIFEGTPEQMWSSICRISALSPDTKIWFGHEYTQSNMKFALYIDDQNPDIKKRMAEIECLLAGGELTVPTTIGDELRTNPFLRTSEPAIRKKLRMENCSDAEVFAILRDQKNRF
jgi:hydroxyacylglutathione hydrolase